MTDSAPDRVFEPEVEWEKARAFLKRRLSAELRGTDAAVIEDLTQEAGVRLLRVLRREGARHLEGLMNAIARRTAIDHIRAMVRWKNVRDTIERDSESGFSTSWGAPAIGDPLTNLRFVVLEYFRSQSSPCLELARAYFEEQKWEGVARKLGRSHDAIRKQWSRCLQMLRAAADKDRDLLGRFLGRGESHDG